MNNSSLSSGKPLSSATAADGSDVDFLLVAIALGENARSPFSGHACRWNSDGCAGTLKGRHPPVSTACSPI
ncbi:hypothetical protein CUJ84_Chr003538 [Rhizobium leguminosarum]|uniref:Uncharacterized protein n=1 Tax=Rhizobium leguminosarum TaxID=384 RepID=A0A2K9Z6L6_RHILE|nr:hypothetical protein CUJ84_Chr003538 [Rhizobium leguminosarum]